MITMMVMLLIFGVGSFSLVYLRSKGVGIYEVTVLLMISKSYAKCYEWSWLFKGGVSRLFIHNCCYSNNSF